MELTKEMVEAGLDRNIMVYDADSTGDVTERLAALMQTVFYRNRDKDDINRLTHIFIPESAYVPIHNWGLPDPQFIHGMEIIRDSRLEHEGEFHKLYIDEGGSFPSTRENLAVGACKDGIMLGAF